MQPQGIGQLPVDWIRNVRIPMPDGITLAADLHKPRVNGKYPAIIEYTPYHKNNNAVYGPRASRYPYFASHGYVFVNVDIRGTGDSEGFNVSTTSPAEVSDGQEVIRWCARQPWCDGSVGMIGISYTAGVCYDAALRAPPELKAIILCQMCSDWYREVVCPGGSPRTFIWENYAPLTAAYNFAPPNPDLVGTRWQEIWQQRLDNSVPWGNAYIENLLDGPFWDSKLVRGREDQIKAATFLIGGWCDYYPDSFLKVFSRLSCPKRVLIGPWTHNYPENAWPLPRINDRYECLRWFDKHLKGLDTDPERPLDHEPPVTLFVTDYTPPDPLRREDAGRFQNEATWPPTHVTKTLWSLSADGHMGGDGAAVSGNRELVYRPDVGIGSGRYVIGQMLPGWGMANDQRLDEAFSLLYTSEPVREGDGLELLGAPVVRLAVSSTAEIAYVAVKLCDVAPDGTSILVTKGGLNLTHRGSDEKPEAISPNEIYEVQIPLLAAAYRFRPGHRLRLMVAAADFQNAWPTPLPHTLTVHHTAGKSCRLELPLAGKRGQCAEPQFRPSEFPPLPPEQIPTPDYSITRDLIRSAVSVNIRTQSGAGVNRSQYTINVGTPANAAVQSQFEYPIERQGMSILVHSNCTTRSDSQAFHHLTQVEITVNGQPHWSKSWTVSVPRVLC